MHHPCKELYKEYIFKLLCPLHSIFQPVVCFIFHVCRLRYFPVLLQVITIQLSWEAVWSSTGIGEGSYTTLGASQSYRHTTELRDISNFLVVPLHQRGNFLDMMSLNTMIIKYILIYRIFQVIRSVITIIGFLRVGRRGIAQYVHTIVDPVVYINYNS